MADHGRGPLRRHLPAILVVVLVAWIILIIVLITFNLHPGSSNPMD